MEKLAGSWELAATRVTQTEAQVSPVIHIFHSTPRRKVLSHRPTFPSTYTLVGRVVLKNNKLRNLRKTKKSCFISTGRFEGREFLLRCCGNFQLHTGQREETGWLSTRLIRLQTPQLNGRMRTGKPGPQVG